MKILLFLIINFAVLDVCYSQRLVAHYPFDGDAIDISKYGNNGSLQYGVSHTEDRFGAPCGALMFNGAGGYVEVKNSNSLQSITKEFTVTAWFKIESSCITDGLKWLTLLCKGEYSHESSNSPQFRVQTFQSNSQSTISINTEFTEFDLQFYNHPFVLDRWNFYALVYDGNNVVAYLNDQMIWSYPYSQNLNQNSESMLIGKDPPGSLEYFCGSLDDLRLYDGALSTNHINDIYRDVTYANFEDEIELSCPDNIIVRNDPQLCGAYVNYPDPDLKINCGSASVKLLKGPSSGSFFNLGATNLTFEATSMSGSKRTCSTKVTVVDKESPSISCCRDTVLYIDTDSESLKYYFKNLSAHDKCGSASIKQTKGLASGSFFKIGKTEQQFEAADASGNITTCSCIVEVVKTFKPPPTIVQSPPPPPPPVVTPTAPKQPTNLNCPKDIIKSNDSGKCGAIVNYSFKDDEGVVKLKEGMESGSFFPVGETQQTLEKKFDNYPVQACNFSITVQDTEKPELKCSDDILAYVTKSEKSKKVSYTFPKGTDNCNIDSIIQLSGLKSGQLFPIGSTTNLFRAIDISGNSTACSFNVIVLDTNTYRPENNEQVQSSKNKILRDSIINKGEYKANNCVITIMMFDDGVQDNDTISIYFNQEEIVKRELIKLRKNGTIIREIKIDPGLKNDLIVRAWNNGQTSPNTLKMNFYEGSFRGKLALLDYTKPDGQKIFHSSPGFADAIYLNCN